MRLSFVRRLLPRAHWEATRGTNEQAIAYCTKEETREAGPWEHGDKPAQGKRSDLTNLVKDIAEGVDEEEIMSNHAHTIVKYPRGYQLLQQHHQKTRVPAWRDVDVQVYWGDTGTGKTRQAMADSDNNGYVLDNYPWWDGYTTQECLILDDFYGGIACHKLLRILDGYRLQLAVKGGFTWAAWSKVIITSNEPPDHWYTKIDGYSGNRIDNISTKVRAALMRRISKVTHFASL